MTAFNNDLQIGQPAMIINVEQPENIGNIGMVVTVLRLMDLRESQDYFGITHIVKHRYAVIDDGSEDGLSGNLSIRQDFLMPLPPLGDVYDQEKMDEMQNLKIYN